MTLNRVTPITFLHDDKSFLERALETVDSYFYLGGKRAYVLQGKTGGREKIILENANSSLISSALKIFSCFFIIPPLVCFVAQKLLRQQHTFHVIDLQKKLSKGIDVSEAMKQEIAKRLPQMLSQAGYKDVTGTIETLGRYCNDTIAFKLKGFPHLVFKCCKAPSCGMQDYFANMIRAKEVCLKNRLDKLVVPHAATFDIEIPGGSKFFLMAEKALKFEDSDCSQERCYQASSKEWDEAIIQMATFIFETGLHKLSWKEIPRLEGDKIGLIALRFMKRASEGFLGKKEIFRSYNSKRGFLKCLSAKQLEVVIPIVFKSTSKQTVELCVEERIAELKQNEQLQQFYAEKQITTGKEPLTVDTDAVAGKIHQKIDLSIELLLDEVKRVVEVINRQIEWGNRHPHSNSERRLFFLNNQNLPNTNSMNLVHEKIFAELSAQRYIFSFQKEQFGFYVQA